MPLLSLHPNEDGNNQTVLFALARAMYPTESSANADLLPEGPCLHRWHWLLPCFPFVQNQDLKKAFSFASKNSNIKISLLLKLKKPHKRLIEYH